MPKWAAVLAVNLLLLGGCSTTPPLPVRRRRQRDRAASAPVSSPI